MRSHHVEVMVEAPGVKRLAVEGASPMSSPGEIPTDAFNGLPWREPGLLWRAAFWGFVLIGTFCGSAAWGWPSLLAAALGLGTIGVLVGTVIWGPLGWPGVPRIVNSGLVTGLGVSAAAGLLAATPGPGALVLLALVCTHPSVAFGARLLLEPLGKSGRSTARVTKASSAPGPQHRQAVSPPPALGTVDDVTLCDIWCQSYLSLCSAASEDESTIIASEREGYLDEMFRRNPSGMAAWFAAGARPGASPMSFLSRRVADG
jgi:hypothetical protein